jgi:hypothetical protein
MNTLFYVKKNTGSPKGLLQVDKAGKNKSQVPGHPDD